MSDDVSAPHELNGSAHTLSPEHRHMLAVGSGLSADIIARRGYRTVTDPAELRRLGFSADQSRLVPALLIPGMTPAGKAWAGCIRPDTPRRNSERKPLKYEHPAGEPQHLDCNPAVLALLGDIEQPIAFVEGQKKADALTDAGLPTIGLNGVYGLFVNGAINPELDDVPLKKRKVYVIFDSDAGTNAKVHQAEKRTANALRRRGAEVAVIRIPPATDGRKQGADDYLAVGHSLNELLALVKSDLDDPPPDEKRKTSADLAAAYVALGHRFSENELTGAIFFNGRTITDADEARLRNELRDNGLGGHLSHARDVMLMLAMAARFNPVKQYIERETWDRNDHIEHLASFVTDRDGLFALALRRWMLGAVERVYRAGAQNRMLVLVGSQGLGKSGLVAHLAHGLDPRYFVQAGIRPDDKDDQIRLAETFIWEVTELGATTRRADVEALKGYLSLTRINIRRPYAKHAGDHQAIASFIGTINNSHTGFLSDPTGERRFVVCDLTQIDWGYSERVNMTQCWAQAKALYDRGERGHFTGAELAKVNAVNARFFTATIAHSGLDVIMEVAPGHFVPTDAIVRELRKRGYEGKDDKLAKDVADWMTRKIAAGERITKARQRVRVTGQAESRPLWGWAGVKMIDLLGEGPLDYADDDEPERPPLTEADMDRLGGVL